MLDNTQRPRTGWTIGAVTVAFVALAIAVPVGRNLAADDVQSAGSQAAAVAAEPVATQEPAVTPSVPAPTVVTVPAAATKVALALAANNQDASVTDAAPPVLEAFRSRRQEALALISSSTVEKDAEVWAFRLSGQFVANTARVPVGQNRPTGDFLYVLVDASNGLVTDWGMMKDKPAFDSLTRAVAS